MKTTIPTESTRLEPLAFSQWDKAMVEYQQLQMEAMIHLFRVPANLLDLPTPPTQVTDNCTDQTQPEAASGWKYQIALGIVMAVVYLLIRLLA